MYSLHCKLDIALAVHVCYCWWADIKRYNAPSLIPAHRPLFQGVLLQGALRHAAHGDLASSSRHPLMLLQQSRHVWGLAPKMRGIAASGPPKLPFKCQVCISSCCGWAARLLHWSLC